MEKSERKYALCAAIPGIFMALITFWAGYLRVVDIYVPAHDYLLAGLAIVAIHTKFNLTFS
ncbi:hypothetical protein ACFX5U_14645 [Sphingobacterium sp. SG20118]|uniref:hypothetical protein n=1 Tax=Sphingobacterium sp. SG20118 TaxID=3367156 RepID=UPI0037DFC295